MLLVKRFGVIKVVLKQRPSITVKTVTKSCGLMNLYDLVLQELSERECAYVFTYPPFYIASVGGHIFNLANKARRIYYVSGGIFDTRLHPFLVAPPGFSKSFWLDHFLDDDCGLIAKTKILTGFEGYMTEAAWVGQVRWQNGEPVKTFGAAYEYQNGIVGCEEFSALTEAMKTTHSRQLDVSLLTSLDKGRVRKRVGPGSIKYETRVTLWAGTQTARLDLSSGMGRRLLTMTFFPTEKDKKILRDSYIKGQNIRYNPVRTDMIRRQIDEKIAQVHKIETLSFDPELFKWCRENKIIHYEIPLYQRLLLGYTVMKLDEVPRRMRVKLSGESKRILELEKRWRMQIKRGGPISQVLMLIKEAGGEISLNVLRDKCVDFAMDWRQSSELVQQMARSKIVRVTTDGKVKLWRKKK